jgi:4-amino-4-deoxy-L-arabinose transferase-like glycosyltransferase
MLGHPWHDWMIPHLNGQLRLEKPPLAYWLAALSFDVFGVNEAAGRLPNVIAGWLTCGVVYCIGRRIFNPRAGFFAAASLLGSYFFFRYSRLAETDVLATFFLTAGILWLWRAADLEDANRRSLKLSSRFILYSHMAAIMIALTILAKGAPAAFGVIFFVAYAGSTKRWNVLWRWLVTGAPLTVAIIAVPWFRYIHTLPEWPVVAEEIKVILQGEEHRSPFYLYFPQTLMAVAPWCAILVIAIIAASTSARENARIRTLLFWSAGVFIALCVAKQRQQHYLITLLPPLALLVGWWLDRAVEADEPDQQRAKTWLLLTVFGVALGCMSAPFIAHHIRGHYRADDFFLALAGVFSSLIVGAFFNRGALRGAIAFALLAPLLLAGFSIWETTLRPLSAQGIADLLRVKYPSAALCFYGENESLPLTWSLRRVVPQYKTQDELSAAAIAHPNLVVIGQEKHNTAPPAIPAGFHEDLELNLADQVYRIYVYRPGGT